MDLALCTGGFVMLKQERAFSKLLPQSWKHRIVKNVIVCCSVKRFPFTGTKRPSQNHEKQPEPIIPPPPNFTVDTMQLPANSSCADVASRGSLELVVSVATEDR